MFDMGCNVLNFVFAPETIHFNKATTQRKTGIAEDIE